MSQVLPSKKRFLLGAATVAVTLCIATLSTGTPVANAQSAADEVRLPPTMYDPPAVLPTSSQWSADLLLQAEPPVEPIHTIPMTGIGLAPGEENPENFEIPLMMFDGPPDPGPAGLQPSVLDDSQWEPRAPALTHNFQGATQTEWTPPDDCLAVGRDHIIECVNDDFLVYDKCGTLLFSADINTFTGDSRFYFDPKVFYDPWHSRWVMLYLVKTDDPQVSQTVLFISADHIPFGLGASWRYNFNALKDAGTSDASWADYVDLGYNNVAVFASGNWFRFAGGFRYSVLRTWDKAEIYNAAAAFTTDDINLFNPSGSQTFGPRAAHMQAASGTTMFFVNSRSGGSTLITIWKLVDALGAHTLTSTDVTVPAYTNPVNAVDPGGNAISTSDARLMNCVATLSVNTDNTWAMYTGLTSGDTATSTRLRMYAFDPFTPALLGTTSFGLSNQFYSMPTAAADYSGNALWSFSRVSPTEFASARYVDSDESAPEVHTWGASTQLKAGNSNYTDFRWGDYHGGQMDFGDFFYGSNEYRIWLVGQYAHATTSWGTWIGNTVVDGLPGAMTVTPASSITMYGFTGGPFSPSSQVFTVENTGDGGLNWSVSGEPSWLDVSVTGSNLGGGRTVNTTASTNAATNALARGRYSSTLSFQDCAINAVLTETRDVTVTVSGPCDPGVICFDDLVAGAAVLIPANHNGHCWSDGCTAGGRWATVDLEFIQNSFGATLPDISTPNVAFNANGDDDCTIQLSNPRHLQRCAITRLPNVGAQGAALVRFVGTLGGSPVFDFTVGTIDDAWSDVSFGGAIVDQLVVKVPEGPGHFWMMDSLQWTCPGDLDGDNQVALSDLAIVLSNFGTMSGATLQDGDLDGDGDVDLQDLATLLSLFGTICS